MTDVSEVEWHIVWDIFREFVLPHSGTLILNVVLFGVLGVVVSIIYAVILYKKGVFRRKPKYYNWSVKLYYPLLIGGIIFFFGQVGFVRGVYKIIDNEKDVVVTGIYNASLQAVFESEESKDAFVTALQGAARSTTDGSTILMERLKETTTHLHTGVSLVDKGKDKVAGYFLEKYKDDIFKAALYGAINYTKLKDYKTSDEPMSYEDFSKAMDLLLEIGYQDIEEAVKNELIAWISSVLKAQYRTFLIPIILFLILLMAFPLLEFLVYKKWVEPSYDAKVAAKVEV